MASNVLRCRYCNLVQFEIPGRDLCRKCGRILVESAPQAAAEPAATAQPIEVARPARRTKRAKPETADMSLPMHLADPDRRRWLLGRRIKHIRHAKGMTQREVASAGKMQRTYITKVETGSCLPTIELLDRLSSALGVPKFDLLNEAADPQLIAANTADRGGPAPEILAEALTFWRAAAWPERNTLEWLISDFSKKHQASFCEYVQV